MIIHLDSADSANVSINWTDLGNATVASVSYTPISGLTLTPQGVTGSVSTVRISGMTHGQIYALEATATLSTGETLNRNVSIRAFNG
jgi:hypothetical protein